MVRCGGWSVRARNDSREHYSLRLIPSWISCVARSILTRCVRKCENRIRDRWREDGDGKAERREGVASSEYRVTSRESRVASCQLPVASCQLPVASCQLPVASCLGTTLLRSLKYKTCCASK